MDMKKTSLKTLLGLPAILLAALGIAFGATRLHDSIDGQSPSTLTAEENASDATTETNTSSTNRAVPIEETTSEYDSLHLELVRQLETMWPESTITHAVVARQAIAGMCWLNTEPTASSEFAPGRVREEWELMSSLLIEGDGPTTVCPEVTSAERSAVVAQMKSDPDRDKLNDLAERWYGTSTTSPDTDGDGFSDTDELTNGYSPLIASTAL